MVLVNPLSLLLQNEKADDLGTWYVALGVLGLPSLYLLNVKVKFASKCILIGFFFKVKFLNTVKANVIILTWYVKTNETMAINKFQRSRLTFALSVKVSHIVVPPIY